MIENQRAVKTSKNTSNHSKYLMRAELTAVAVVLALSLSTCGKKELQKPIKAHNHTCEPCKPCRKLVRKSGVRRNMPHKKIVKAVVTPKAPEKIEIRETSFKPFPTTQITSQPAQAQTYSRKAPITYILRNNDVIIPLGNEPIHVVGQPDITYIGPIPKKPHNGLAHKIWHILW